MSARDIALALAGRRRAQSLAGGGYLVPCPLPSHGRGCGDRSPSLSIVDGDDKLLVHCFGGCDARDVLDELRRRGLLDREAARAAPTRPSPPPRRDDYAEQQHRKAAWLWSRRQPIGGTIAEKYLRERRRITCALPATLGFLAPHKPAHHPALIAAFGLPDELEPGVFAPPHVVEAVHLTLLKPDGGKADVAKPKLVVGSPGEVPIALAPVNDLGGLAVAEGIEDALTFHQATGLGAWAAGCAGRLPAMAAVVPPHVESVTVMVDDDPAGRRHAEALAQLLSPRVLEVRLANLTELRGAP